MVKARKVKFWAVLLATVILAAAAGSAALANSVQPGSSPPYQYFQKFISKLAANLGVDESTLNSALETTKKQMLDEAVQEGRITQEQADKIAAGRGLGLFMRGFGPRHGGPNGPDGKGAGLGKGPGIGLGWGRNAGEMAAILGITAEELKAELDSGKNLVEIVTSRGLTWEDFCQKMLEYKKEQIQKAVEDGKLTREQADQMIQRLENRPNCPWPAPKLKMQRNQKQNQQ